MCFYPLLLGTKLEKRLARGDQGVNPLDTACKSHDIAYHLNKDLGQRHKADKILEEAAWQRVKSKDSSVGEKMAAWAVTTAMKTKRKMGMGARSRGRKTANKNTPKKTNNNKSNSKRTTKRVNRKANKKSKRQQKAKGQLISFNGGVLQGIKKDLKQNKDYVNVKDKKNLRSVARTVLAVAKRIVKHVGGKKKVQRPRVIPVPKHGGVLPLIPIFAGLSALGGLAGGISGIVNAVKKAQIRNKQYEDGVLHNRTMEAIAMGKKKSGEALYMKPYKKGGALFLKPYPKN